MVPHRSPLRWREGRRAVHVTSHRRRDDVPVRVCCCRWMEPEFQFLEFYAPPRRASSGGSAQPGALPRAPAPRRKEERARQQPEEEEALPGHGCRPLSAQAPQRACPPTRTTVFLLMAALTVPRLSLRASRSRCASGSSCSKGISAAAGSGPGASSGGEVKPLAAGGGGGWIGWRGVRCWAPPGAAGALPPGGGGGGFATFAGGGFATFCGGGRGAARRAGAAARSAGGRAGG